MERKISYQKKLSILKNYFICLYNFKMFFILLCSYIEHEQICISGFEELVNNLI